MPTVVIYAEPATYTDTSDGHDIGSSDATYATARAGSNLTLSPTIPAGNNVGQTTVTGVYYVNQNFEQFDTSYIGSGSTVSAVVYEASCNWDVSTTDFVIEGRIHDFGALPVATDDWVAGADLSSKTLVVTLATSGITVNDYNTYTDVALPANINKTGYTRLLFCSKEQTDNSTPTGDEYVAMDSGQWFNPPRMTITYSGSTSVLMVYADVATAASVSSNDVTYSTARAGADLVTDTTFVVGQSHGTRHFIYESFIEFDTVLAVGSVTQVDIDIGADYILNVVTDFVIEARLEDYGGGEVTTADWVAGADLSSKTLLATAPTTSLSNFELTWTSESAFLSNINDAGYTRIILVSKNTTDDSSAPDSESIDLAELPRPRLIIQYTATDLYDIPPTDDVTTTGWSSTPLWSKIDDDPDSPDATVITATAS